MKRIQTIYEVLKKQGNKGLTTKEVSSLTSFSRNNVSSDLNELVRMGKARKESGKPVYYFPKEEKKTLSKERGFDLFLIENPSLSKAIEQAKAAVLYPPNGMNTLLLGETGTGKSMFAEMLFSFGKEMKRFTKNEQLISFNCADYSHNPQMLLAQLFGVKKNAFTGANDDRKGLIELANQGVLFLDEVHRLPPEGQEMLFTFMDKGTFRRLGETENERSSQVMIIAATTENPATTLLETFVRRMPMVIKLPNLKSRQLEERFALIKYFINQESAKLKEPITVSINSLRAFLSYECRHNIGELKSDVQLACAKAYAEYLSNHAEKIQISALDLSEKVNAGLLLEVQHRKLWNKIIGINQRYFEFSGEATHYLEEPIDQQDIYELIDHKKVELTHLGISGKELEENLNKEIHLHFEEYMNQVKKDSNQRYIENLVDQRIISSVERMIQYAESQLETVFGNRVFYGLALHLEKAVSRVKKNHYYENQLFENTEESHPREYQVSYDCIRLFNQEFEIELPISEANYLTLFFVYGNHTKKQVQEVVRVFVVTHGESTATSIVNTVNQLLGEEYGIGFDVPLSEKPQDSLLRIKAYIQTHQIKAPILFMVDMGSLNTFGNEISKTFGIDTQTIQLVSTLHVLEAVRKAMLGYPLQAVYKETLAVNLLIEEELQEHSKKNSIKFAIVTICTTGEGTAKVLKNILTTELNFDEEVLEIIAINLIDKEDIYSRLASLSKTYEIICIVSPFHLAFQYPHFDLVEVIEKSKIQEIQQLVDLAETYGKLGKTLAGQLKYVDSEEVVVDVKKLITALTIQFSIESNLNVLIGLAFHLACMIDREFGGEKGTEFLDKEFFMRKHADEIQLIQEALRSIEYKYQIKISEDEVCYMVSFFINTH